MALNYSHYNDEFDEKTMIGYANIICRHELNRDCTIMSIKDIYPSLTLFVANNKKAREQIHVVYVDKNRTVDFYSTSICMFTFQTCLIFSNRSSHLSELSCQETDLWSNHYLLKETQSLFSSSSLIAKLGSSNINISHLLPQTQGSIPLSTFMWLHYFELVWLR
ncbi:hypothetical protein BD560DRAFT_488131 [Blakeslea trispora]|nr:hypothetical protein BD560DRAFT_488131 [Blakeslea trispora]